MPEDNGEYSVQQLTDESFKTQVSQAKGFVLVDFWAPWCGPCKALMPHVEEALAEANWLKGYSLNIDENPVTPSDHSIMSIPTLILFKDGQQLDILVGGSHTKDDLITWLNKHKA